MNAQLSQDFQLYLLLFTKDKRKEGHDEKMRVAIRQVGPFGDESKTPGANDMRTQV